MPSNTCGAGIFYPADLPGFKGLVDEIYRRNGATRSDIERAALDRGQFAAALDMLERRLPRGSDVATSMAAEFLVLTTDPGTGCGSRYGVQSTCWLREGDSLPE